MSAQTIWGVLPVVQRVMEQLRSGLAAQITATLAEGSVPDGLELPALSAKAIGLGDASTLPLTHAMCVRVVPASVAVRPDARLNAGVQRAEVGFHVHCYVSLLGRIDTVDPTYQTQQMQMVCALAAAVRAVVERSTEDSAQQIGPAQWQGEAIEDVATLRDRAAPQVWALVRQTYTCTVISRQSRGSVAPS